MLRILDFPDIQESEFKQCLGVLGYLMVNRRDKKDYTFVPSKFIRPLSLKAKNDLISYLIQNNYIIKVEKDESKEEKMYKAYNYFMGKGFKEAPNIYYLTLKILVLAEMELTNQSVKKTVLTNLHHLHGQSFNHWIHNYQHISINVPDDETWQSVVDESYYYHNVVEPSARPIGFHLFNLQTWARNYGSEKIRNYDNTITGTETYRKRSPGIENRWGKPSNIFTVCNPILRNYTSLEQAVEVGIKFSEGVIIADQLLKGFGTNDFTTFFLDRAAAYEEKLKAIQQENRKLKRKGKKLKKLPDPLSKSLLPEDDYYKEINQYFIAKEKAIIEENKDSLPGPRHRKLFVLPEDDERTQLEYMLQDLPGTLEQYEVTPDEMKALFARHKNENFFYRDEINNALFGYKHNWFFYTHFRGLWSDILYHIKAGNGYYFTQFVGEAKPGTKLAFTKDDERIRITDKDGNYLDSINGPEIYKRGQIYYKAVSLKKTLRENEIMKKIWVKLQRCKILCIPINDKVLVSGSDLDAVVYITLETWREHLDPKIKIFPEVIKRY